MGLIAYASSVTVTRVDLLSVVELTCRLSMWTSTEIAGWPNLRATRVACALGYCREIVHGTAVFTAALCGFRRNGAPRPEVLEQLFRRFWCGAVAWGRSVSDGLAAGSPPSGLCGC
jgi:hypothetical protein